MYAPFKADGTVYTVTAAPRPAENPRRASTSRSMPAVNAPTTSETSAASSGRRDRILKQQRGLDLQHSGAPEERRRSSTTRRFDEAGLPVAVLRDVDPVTGGDGGVVAAGLREPRPRCGGALHIPFFERLRVSEMTRGHLEFPSLGGLDPEPSGVRVERTEVEVPPIVIGLAAVEDRGFEHERSAIDPGGHDTERDVRRIERVM